MNKGGGGAVEEKKEVAEEEGKGSVLEVIIGSIRKGGSWGIQDAGTRWLRIDGSRLDVEAKMR